MKFCTFLDLELNCQFSKYEKFLYYRLSQEILWGKKWDAFTIYFRTSSILKLFYTILRLFQRNCIELILFKKKLGRLKKIPYVSNQDNMYSTMIYIQFIDLWIKYSPF